MSTEIDETAKCEAEEKVERINRAASGVEIYEQWVEENARGLERFLENLSRDFLGIRDILEGYRSNEKKDSVLVDVENAAKKIYDT